MQYWLNLFTGTTWEEFRVAGAQVTGFRDGRRSVATQIKTGDILICYLTGVMRWVGTLKVVAPTKQRTQIWKADQFPIRFVVKPLILLNPEHGIPMEELMGRVRFFADDNDRGSFHGFLRSAPNLFKRKADGELIVQLLRGAAKNPITRHVD